MGGADSPLWRPSGPGPGRNHRAGKAAAAARSRSGPLDEVERPAPTAS